ncbi:hypothetical protein CEK62_13545 [Alcanivorax sp. N3-2A]|nr:hypothetical protein CEK62_13545 [Alcanivorax sp. N3-2A]
MNKRRANRRLLQRLLFAGLLLLAQSVMAWHAPSHILDRHDNGSTLSAQQDCELCVHGHGLVALPGTPPLLAPPAAAVSALAAISVDTAPTFPPAHPARAPPSHL